MQGKLDTATFAGGCFWCFDAVFRHVKGVEKVASGFAGGEGDIDYNSIHYSPRGYAEAVSYTHLDVYKRQSKK